MKPTMLHILNVAYLYPRSMLHAACLYDGGLVSFLSLTVLLLKRDDGKCPVYQLQCSKIIHVFSHQ
jgi:hypothetical protein